MSRPITDCSPFQGSSEESWDAERWSMGRDEAHLQQYVCSKWRTVQQLASTPQNHLHAQRHGLWHVRPLASSSWHYIWSCLLCFQCHHLPVSKNGKSVCKYPYSLCNIDYLEACKKSQQCAKVFSFFQGLHPRDITALRNYLQASKCSWRVRNSAIPRSGACSVSTGWRYCWGKP